MRITSLNNIFLMMTFMVVALIFTSCDPQLDEKIALGNPPGEVTFNVTEVTDKDNTYTLSNTTPGAFIYNWSLGNGTTAQGDNIEVQYPNAGEYDITLEVVTDGGVGESAPKTVTVANDLPVSCESLPVFQFLSNCNTRTWRLVNEEGAYSVGPTDRSEVWWQIGTSDIEERPCAFNDEWTFTVDQEFIYDTKGDVWAEDYFGFNFECVDEELLSETIRPWGSGNHSFTVNAEGASEFTVFGQGAFMGLPKATNGQEITSPVGATTYTVTKTETQQDRLFLEIEVNYTAGIWTFRFESDL